MLSERKFRSLVLPQQNYRPVFQVLCLCFMHRSHLTNLSQASLSFPHYHATRIVQRSVILSAGPASLQPDWVTKVKNETTCYWWFVIYPGSLMATITLVNEYLTMLYLDSLYLHEVENHCHHHQGGRTELYRD